MSEITKMSDIHTIVFMTNTTEIPIEKHLIPTSARTLNILCDPQRYGWRPIHHTKRKDGIVYIDMRLFQISSDTILEFVRTLRNGFIICSNYDISNMEKFAILIGAGGKGCPFQKIINNNRKQRKRKEKEEKKFLIKSNNCPSVPQEDINNLFYWEIASLDYARENLISDEWTVTGKKILGEQLYYFRKRKPTVSSDI